LGKKYKIYVEIGMEVQVYKHCTALSYTPATSIWKFKMEDGIEIQTTLGILVEEEWYVC